MTGLHHQAQIQLIDFANAIIILLEDAIVPHADVSFQNELENKYG